jgi:hypothetical protein
MNWKREFHPRNKEPFVIVTSTKSKSYWLRTRSEGERPWTETEEPITHEYANLHGVSTFHTLDKLPQTMKEANPHFGKVELRKLFLAAEKAGKEAYDAVTPIPMIVQQHVNPLDDNSRVKQEWHVPEGVCGFGWVTIRPANSQAANYAKKHHGGGYSDYQRAMIIYPRDRSQSYERKMAWARAYAGVLAEAGIRAHADGRLD